MKDIEILLVFCSSEKPIADIQQQFKWTNRTKFRDKYINPMLHEGLLEMTIPDKPNSRLQKYRITLKGQQILGMRGRKMNDNSTNISEWKVLYEAAIKFKELGAWDWMSDQDIFGVLSPFNDEIGYCCVLGNAGECFGLAVYLGSEGLEGYLKMQSGEINAHSTDVLHLQKCLMVSFDDREFLQKDDLNLIKALGLKFKGRNSWPMFRNYQPGYYPWYLTPDETKYLTFVLEQAADVCRSLKNNPKLFISPLKNQYLVRVFKAEKDSSEWRDEWLTPKTMNKTKYTNACLDNKRMEEIKKLVTRRKGIWEIDYFYNPEPVREGEERPYYPYVVLCVDQYSGFVFKAYLVKQEEFGHEFPEYFLGIIESNKLLPQEILVAKEEIFRLLEPIASFLGIELKITERLTELEMAKSEMIKFFRK